MSDRLPVPPELEYLLEKREETEHRLVQQRGIQDRRAKTTDSKMTTDSETEFEATTADRRSGQERRLISCRRKKKRRKKDS